MENLTHSKGLTENLELIGPDLEIVEDSTTDFKLVGKVLSQKKCNFKALKEVLSSAWNLKDKVFISFIEGNNFICSFKDEKDRSRVLRTGPWNFRGGLIIFEQWDGSMSFSDLTFTNMEFWVQIYNLPLDRMTAGNARTIGKFLGTYICGDGDVSTLAINRNFLRIRVAVKLTSPLKTGFSLEKTNGSRIWVEFKYERLGDFCYCCGRIGHVLKDCSINNDIQDGARDLKSSHGPWMRASASNVQVATTYSHPNSKNELDSQEKVLTPQSLPSPSQHKPQEPNKLCLLEPLPSQPTTYQDSDNLVMSETTCSPLADITISHRKSEFPQHPETSCLTETITSKNPNCALAQIENANQAQTENANQAHYIHNPHSDPAALSIPTLSPTNELN